MKLYKEKNQKPSLRIGGGQHHKLSRETKIFVVEMILMLLICLVHSLSAGHYADFIPINGTFQNYNPVRRFLHGQIPYRDFQDYLGMGHLYAGTIATALFGGSYRDSLMAFSFLTFGSLAMFSMVIGWSVFGKKSTAAAVTNIFLIIILVEPLFLTNGLAGTNDILGALTYALGTGNSARFIRGMILPIACFLLWICYRVLKKKGIKKNWSEKKKFFICYISIGLVSGFSFVWSNDFGISSWLCFLILTLWLTVSRTRSFKKTVLAVVTEEIASVVGVLVSAEIFTLGHAVGWLKATFGTGGYQAWYYSSGKSYYLYDVDFTWIMLIQAGITIYYLVRIYQAKGSAASVKRFGLPAFANMASFAAVNEYKLLSGGNSREVALAILFFTVVYELINLIPWNVRIRRAAYAMSFIAAGAWIISAAKDEAVFDFFTDKGGTYVAAMDGNLTSLGEDLLDANQFINGEKIFATYASAQEVVSDTYQPSGTDYIIHVLGDKQRKEYLNAFDHDDFRYAVTLNETYSDWEPWCERSNWFWYRDLFRNWHPVYENGYELYWERNEEKDEHLLTDGYTVSVQDVNETTKKIIVQCDDENVNGMADVLIDYAVKKKPGKSSHLVWQEQLYVANTGTMYAGLQPASDNYPDAQYFESNYLRAVSKEYVPVPVVNGYGEITITSNPQRNTYLELNQADCNGILTVYSDYVELSGITYNGDGTSTIVFANRPRIVNALNGVKMVSYNGERAEILDTNSDNSSVYAHVDKKLEAEQRNMVRLLK